jgi:hypothetical protein
MSPAPTSVSATFTISLAPGEEVPGAAARFTMEKTWSGGLQGVSHGTMLTAGDPASGSAGYVATELFDGAVDGRSGTLAFQQLGLMAAGEPTLQYVIAPGSGTGELEGLTGTLEIGGIDDDGVHQVTVILNRPDQS